MDLTGIGLYSLKEAERLTGAQSREVSRWLFGYRAKDRTNPPLWRTQLADLEDEGKFIGFRDLLELRVVKAFTQHNVPLQVIRAALRNAKEMFSTQYPFTTHRFLTDGRSIFREAVQEQGDVELIDLVKRQKVFEHVIRPELYAGIQFGSDGLATRWYPIKNSEKIVLDPSIAFGKPILTDFGIRTDIIAAAFAVEKDKKAVAAQYDISVDAVNAALRYERLAA
jgi:uncharacterized protein (DUF433 family)